MVFKMEVSRMWTNLAQFLAYSALGLKIFTTKTPMTGNFQCILLIMDLGKTLFFSQILVSKHLYSISFLVFMQTFFNNRKTFPISLKLLVVWDPNFYGLTIILQLITILFTFKKFWVTILTLSITYELLTENLKTGITSKGNFSSTIIYITHLHKFYMKFLKSGWKY